MAFKKNIVIILSIMLLILTPVSTGNVFKNTKIPLRTNSLKFLNQEQFSFFEYGKEIGIKYYKIYHILKNLIFRFSQNDIIKKFTQNSYKILGELEKSCPSFIEELQGLSSSTNIKTNCLIIIGRILSIFIKGSCTNTLSTGNATQGNKTYLTQNIDQTWHTLGLFLIRTIFSDRYHIYRGKGYNYIYFGIPILWEYPIINEKGLGFGATGTALTDNPNRSIDHYKNGIPTYCLERITMRNCSNVSQVAELWKSSNRSSDKNKVYPRHWDFASPVFCDSEDGILLIEQTHNYISCIFRDSIEITKSKEDILWHTNHHLYLNPYETGSKLSSEYNSSKYRAERANYLLESNENYGKINLNVCKNIIRDHHGGSDLNKKDSYDICRHPDKNDSHTTAMSWIVEISSNKLKFYWTRGQPCSPSFFMRHFRSRNFPFIRSIFYDSIEKFLGN